MVSEAIEMGATVSEPREEPTSASFTILDETEEVTWTGEGTFVLLKTLHPGESNQLSKSFTLYFWLFFTHFLFSMNLCMNMCLNVCFLMQGFVHFFNVSM